jgi:hypothetical protein
MPDNDFLLEYIDFESDPSGDPLAGLFDLPNPDVAAEPTSTPVYTVELGPVTLTVIKVDFGGRDSYQVYAIDDESWSLVGYFGLFTDALLELRTWRRFAADGHTLQEWLVAHPDGVRVDQSTAVAS